MKRHEKSRVRKHWTTTKSLQDWVQQTYEELISCQTKEISHIQVKQQFADYFTERKILKFHGTGEISPIGLLGESLLQNGTFWALWLAIYATPTNINIILSQALKTVSKEDLGCLSHQTHKFLLNQPVPTLLSMDFQLIKTLLPSLQLRPSEHSTPAPTELQPLRPVKPTFSVNLSSKRFRMPMARMPTIFEKPKPKLPPPPTHRKSLRLMKQRLLKRARGVSMQ